MMSWNEAKKLVAGAAKYALQLGLCFGLLASAEMAQRKLLSRKGAPADAPEEIIAVESPVETLGRSPASSGGSIRHSSAAATRYDAGYLSPSSEFREQPRDAGSGDILSGDGVFVDANETVPLRGSSQENSSLQALGNSRIGSSTATAVSTSTDGSTYVGGSTEPSTSTATATGPYRDIGNTIFRRHG